MEGGECVCLSGKGLYLVWSVCVSSLDCIALPILLPEHCRSFSTLPLSQHSVQDSNPQNDNSHR